MGERLVEQLHGFPFWKFGFDEDGRATSPELVERSIEEIAAPSGPAELFVFSHGWNNDQKTAQELYAAFFGEFRRLLDNPPPGVQRPNARLGIAGVFWPSILCLMRCRAGHGGAAGFRGTGARNDVPLAALQDLFSGLEEPALLRELVSLLIARPRSEEALGRFREGLRVLMTGGVLAGPTRAGEDSPELALPAAVNDDTWKEMLEILGDQERGAPFRLRQGAPPGGLIALTDSGTEPRAPFARQPTGE